MVLIKNPYDNTFTLTILILNKTKQTTNFQRISSAAIASANREVQSLLSKTRKRSPYQRYSPEERAVIGRFATEHGVPAAVTFYHI